MTTKYVALHWIKLPFRSTSYPLLTCDEKLSAWCSIWLVTVFCKETGRIGSTEEESINPNESKCPLLRHLRCTGRIIGPRVILFNSSHFRRMGGGLASPWSYRLDGVAFVAITDPWPNLC
eukprot:scaffold2353_cov167-Amphora_coffeaeformis.AAC.49